MKRALVAAIALAAACGPSSESDLPHPVVALVRYQGGFCSSGIYAAADGSVWTESGCEAHSSGWSHVRDISATARADLDAKWQAVRVEGDTTSACTAAGDTRYHADRDDTAGTGMSITLCSDGLGPAAQAFVDAMKAIGPPGW